LGARIGVSAPHSEVHDVSLAPLGGRTYGRDRAQAVVAFILRRLTQRAEARYRTVR
jgi:hypothetical protein